MGCILPDEESPISPELPVLQLVISQVKDADLLWRVLGDVREHRADKSPDRVQLIILTAASGCHRRCVKRGNLIWLGSSVTEKLGLRFESKAYIESTSIFVCHFISYKL